MKQWCLPFLKKAEKIDSSLSLENENGEPNGCGRRGNHKHKSNAILKSQIHMLTGPLSGGTLPDSGPLFVTWSCLCTEQREWAKKHPPGGNICLKPGHLKSLCYIKPAAFCPLKSWKAMRAVCHCKFEYYSGNCGIRTKGKTALGENSSRWVSQVDSFQ